MYTTHRRKLVVSLHAQTLQLQKKRFHFDSAFFGPKFWLMTKRRGTHLIGHLAITGLLCLGPVDGDAEPSATTGSGTAANATGQRLVLALDPRGRACSNLTRPSPSSSRYVRSHGPATLKDFAWWTKLPLKDHPSTLIYTREGLRSRERACQAATEPQTPQRTGLQAFST